jgi:hypothetical protein
LPIEFPRNFFVGLSLQALLKYRPHHGNFVLGTLPNPHTVSLKKFDSLFLSRPFAF